MKKRLLAGLMCLCLLVGLLPATALAAGVTDCPGGDGCNHEAAIGNTHYDTLKEAMNAATLDSTVQLLRDVEKQYVVTAKCYNVTVDLNGFNITTTEGAALKFDGQGDLPEEGVLYFKVINTQPEKGGVLLGKTTAVNITAKTDCPLLIGDGVTLESSKEGSNLVEVKGAAYLPYNMTNEFYINKSESAVSYLVNAKDGEQRIYGVYSNAVKAAEDNTATLIYDYQGGARVDVEDTQGILDLGGHTYTYSSNNAIVYSTKDNGSITIKNGTMITTNNKSDGIDMLGSNTSVRLEKVDMTVSGGTYGIVTNGNKSNNAITLKNSTLNVPDGYGIYFPSSGSVAIEDSVINAKYSGVQMCSGNLTVKGDKTAITTTGEPQPKTEDDGAIADGAAISVINRSYPGGSPTMSITGGTFSSENADAVKAYTFSNTDKTEGEWEDAKESVSISGGTFSSDVTAYLDEGCKWDNNTNSVVPSDDSVASIGSKGYNSLGAAITAAGQMTGDVTITLLDNVDVSDSSARTYDLSASGLSGLTICGASQDVQIISRADGNGIDGPTYCPVLSLKLPENAPLTIENLTAPNDLLFDTAENGTLVVRNCVFNGAQSGYPKAESISYLNNTFEFKGTADNFYSHNAYPVWYKVNDALDFVFEGNTVIGYRGVHIETRGSDASKQVNISVNNNHFTLEDADHEKKEVALQLVNHLNGNISFSNNHVDGYMGVCFYKDIVVTEDTELTIQNNDTTGKLYGSSEWNADGATPEEQEAAADAFAESVINGIPEEDKNIAAGHTEHHYVDGTCTICGKKEPVPVEPDGPSSDNERTYAIVTEDDGHGSVTVSADEASAGTRITVTVKPDAGYELDELTVTDAKNKDLKVTKRSETTYTFHMADSKVTVEASFTKDGTVQKPDTRFDDVAKSAWYYKAVEYVAENGIMSGVSAREFAPNAGFSRAMLAQTLYAMSGKPTVKAEGTFADVAANAWYADAVNWAAEKGYVSGVGDGKFAPDASITREQMALILYRYAGSPDASGMVLREFADGDSVSAYAVDAIRWAVHEGLISGMENNTLAPQGTATRAQVAQILMNFHQKLDK